jgi:DNA/RNA endonuclease G (NUC1)/V8-like Glu-specific endopeptidase
MSTHLRDGSSGAESLFLRNREYTNRRATTADGFESLAPRGTASDEPAPDAPPSPQQAARAVDLFLRGALTPDQLERARASRSGFEVIIGRSNLLPAVFLEIGVAVSRATCLVRTSGVDFLGRSGEWSGTGTLLSHNILLTNNHVLNSREVAAAANCVFNYQVGVDGKPMSTRTFRVRPDRLFLTSPARDGLDFTLVWVDGSPGQEFGSVRLDRTAFAITEDEFANVISHPGGRMKTVALQENEVRWQDEVVVHYTSDTEPGSSGASVCNNNWQLVALHHASKESSLTEHPVLNEGIKLSAIAAWLEQVSRSGGAAAAHAREVLTLFRGVDEELGFFGTLGRGVADPAPGVESVADSYRGTEKDIDVGFWNVEWLTKHYDTKAQVVARVVREMQLDVWSLEESSPNAAKAIVEELRQGYGLNYEWAAAEPSSEDGKQSCTLLWNAETVSGRPEPWGEPVESWLQAHSHDFGDLGLEAVHGKIFDRYPALFHFASRGTVGGKPFDFYLVPLHLKAMAEGSVRRRMAAKILAAAIQKKIELGADADWIVGGDYNAELATQDFDALTTGGMIAVSAEDEQGGAFSYIKGPQSLIDHIFLSPNLAERFGASDFFIVAADRTFPNYVQDVSDHRPVLIRLGLDSGGGADRAGGGFEALETGERSAALRELLERIAPDGVQPPGSGLPGGESAERARRPRRGGRPQPVRAGAGYDPRFLGSDGLLVPAPGLPEPLARQAVVVDPRAAGPERFLLHYTHFSVAMNGERRMAFYSAANIDGNELRRIPRSGDRWEFDPRIAESLQTGDDVYRNNDLDRGHLTRRLDPVWGARDVAARANEDTFFFTNACPQHKDLNQKEWNDLEDYVLDNANTHDMKVSVFTGPVFGPDDKPYRGILLPGEFWKVVVMVREDTGKLSATGYLLSQQDMLTGFEFVFGRFRTYQVTLQEIERKTGLDLGPLKDFDPLSRARAVPGGFEAVTGSGPAREIRGPQDPVL